MTYILYTRRAFQNIFFNKFHSHDDDVHLLQDLKICNKTYSRVSTQHHINNNKKYVKEAATGGQGPSWRRPWTLLEETKDPLGGGQGTSLLAEPS